MRKGKFNWIDILIILAVLVVGAGIWARFGGHVERATGTTTEFTYQIVVQKIRQQTMEALVSSVGLQFNMEDKARSDDMGKLLSVDVKPAMKEVEKTDGTTVLAEIPERYDCVLTLSLRGVVNNYGYFTPQLSNIGAGSQVKFKSKYAKVEGYILGVLRESPFAQVDDLTDSDSPSSAADTLGEDFTRSGPADITRDLQTDNTDETTTDNTDETGPNNTDE